MQIIDIIPIQDYKNKQYIKDRKILKLLEKQNYQCKFCSIIALELIILYDKNSSKIDFIVNALNSNGEERKMTIDHIVPKSKGGKNHSNNCQILCYQCNQKKGNKSNEEFTRISKLVNTK